MVVAADGAPQGRRVGFLIAGVQKAGTSSLFAILSAHRQVARGRSKELHFFDNEDVKWDDPSSYDAYNAKIRWQKRSVIAGDATPRYLFWPGALERVRDYNPAMKIIVSFRDPIERAFSQWAMGKERNAAQADFGPVILEAHATQWPRTVADAGVGPRRSIVTRGYYGQQLEHAYGLFDRSQVLLLDYHRVFAELESTVSRMARFLGIRPFRKLPVAPHKRAAPKELVALPPSADDISTLAELYARDLEVFAGESGLDVSGWPTTRVIDGRLDPGELAAELAARCGLIPPISP